MGAQMTVEQKDAVLSRIGDTADKLLQKSNITYSQKNPFRSTEVWFGATNRNDIYTNLNNPNSAWKINGTYASVEEVRKFVTSKENAAKGIVEREIKEGEWNPPAAKTSSQPQTKTSKTLYSELHRAPNKKEAVYAAGTTKRTEKKPEEMVEKLAGGIDAWKKAQKRLGELK